jgi:large conductance mechanosensitive channel
MFKEFRDFAMRGNVVDMAVGIIIGAAFGGIVKSFTDDIIMPPIGLLIGHTDFKDFFLSLNGQTYASIAAAKAAGAPVIAYGLFFNTVFNFLIVAFAMFILVKQMNRLQGPAPEPTTGECKFCLSSIPKAATKCAHCCSAI